ncbi:PHD zinc finger protein [Teratosphaeria destructans]|uniref:PHD zinc finger protein n=1 Tax=Teratosphaeria destructans TaxID=418781 RepID=A0A9W7W2K3_9PEZI|nr:PHD zinc finger protein [Teratosphaeria destructans]
MPSERVKSAQDVDYRVLDFFRDDEDSCALTAQVNNVRFHIIADSGKIRKGTTGQTYRKLLDAVKGAEVDEAADGTDSGVDVSNGGDGKELDKGSDPEEQLHRWMLAPLTSQLEELAPAKEAKEMTLKHWYDGPVHFFDLESQDDEPVATELEPTEELQRRIRALVPDMAIPKYIQRLDVPRIPASDLTVLSGHDDPPPHHPARVRAPDGTTSFLKLAGGPQGAQATKRELRMLHQVATKGLHDRIRCPRLEALVLYDGALWIIDFGGSYTPGWVDPEVKETEEGDDQGVRKIGDALQDPGAEVGDPETSRGGGGRSGVGDSTGKRKAEDEGGRGRKQRKGGVARGKGCCWCGRPGSGRMVRCDGGQCAREWFHFECVGLKAAPGAEEEWLCGECRDAV